MKRALPAILCAAFFMAACALWAAPAPAVPTSPPRTPVPTWTLAFESALRTPTPPGPVITYTLVVPTLSPTPTPELPTSTPSASPTARPGIDPTLGASTPDPSITPALPIPEPMPQLHLDEDIVNILLLGRDTARETRSYRTDVMIVVSINKEAHSVTMLTIPRDLFVYIPGWTMNRINQAAERGDAIGYPGGGVALLEQTILYNLGIPIHGWARVDFQGFKNVVDIVGGVDIPVTCRMEDWRLKDPALDDQNPDNWELYTVETGVQHMEGDLALWYARSRKRSSDFARSRRQHQVLRAIFDQGLRLNMLAKVPELYTQYVQIVDTDMGLGDLLQFVPMAAQLDRSRIKSRFIGRNQTFPWVTPAGAQVLLPDRDAISALLAEAFLPPAENVLAREAPSVEVWNGTPNFDWSALAADNLAWAGIQPAIGQADAITYTNSIIYDFTTSPKGSALPELKRIFGVSSDNVIAVPDPKAPHPFRVVLGNDYNSCVRSPPAVARPLPTPGPGGPILQGENIIHAAAVLEPPPGVDSDLSEWTFLVYPLDEPIFGGEERQGLDDLSGVWNAAWDEDYLYLALQVKDDVFVQLGTGERLFMGDSLEVWFDADLPADSADKTLSGDDFQLGLSPGDLTSPFGGSEAYLWFPQGEARSIEGVVIAARLVNASYDIEVAIPWQVFRVTPRAGRTFGFALALNDDDTPGSAEQQTQTSNRKDQRLTDPTTWGILVLDPPPAP